jgi:CLASP N terminal
MFRSPTNARASPRIPKNQVPEGPIHDFTTVIETTAPEEWQRRTTSFMNLVAEIPTGTAYSAQEAWYNSPATLRHLAIPVSELLKDPRSSVVRLTCESSDELFSKCQLDARYLLKDIMPAILQVHSQTVQVIRNYVQTMVVDALSVVPCKMAMPIWLDRLKNDKSRTVREACCLYLATAIAEWTEEGYLSREIYQQVGTALLNALRDQSPAVRQNAKKGLENFYLYQPDLLNEMIASDRSFTRDYRVKKLLQRIQAGEAVGDDNMSVASRSSRVSTASAPVRGFRSGTTSRTSNKRGGGGGGAFNFGPPPRRIGRQANGSNMESPSKSRGGIPSTIGVASSIPSPKTTKAEQESIVKTRGGGLGPPRRVVTTALSPDSSNGTMNGNIPDPSTPMYATPPPNTIDVDTGGTPQQGPNSPTNDLPSDLNKQVLQQSFDSAESDTSELQPIASTTQLREAVKSLGGNRRRSSLLQDRLLSSHSSSSIGLPTVTDESERSHTESSSNLMDVAHLQEGDISSNPNVPEHTKIAHQLLEAHKIHVDTIMELLKVEMDALKEFELILLEEGPRRPTEEEVLEYFESLGLCLEQRTKAGMILQKKMDRISKGK